MPLARQRTEKTGEKARSILKLGVVWSRARCRNAPGQAKNTEKQGKKRELFLNWGGLES